MNLTLDPVLDLAFLSGAPVGGGPPPTPTQLAAPSLIADPLALTSVARQATIVVSGPASWPAGTLVQLQTRRGAGAWTNAGAPVAASAVLAFPREATGFAVLVRGIAQAPGDEPADSEPSGAITVTVPALDAPQPVPPTPTSVPATVRFTLEAAPLPRPAGQRVRLLQRARNWLTVRDVVDPDADAYVALDALRWAVVDRAGDPLVAGQFSPLDGGRRWRAELMLDAQPDLGEAVALIVTAALDGAQWPYRYPLDLREALG